MSLGMACGLGALRRSPASGAAFLCVFLYVLDRTNVRRSRALAVEVALVAQGSTSPPITWTACSRATASSSRRAKSRRARKPPSCAITRCIDRQPVARRPERAADGGRIGGRALGLVGTAEEQALTSIRRRAVRLRDRPRCRPGARESRARTRTGERRATASEDHPRRVRFVFDGRPAIEPASDSRRSRRATSTSPSPRYGSSRGQRRFRLAAGTRRARRTHLRSIASTRSTPICAATEHRGATCSRTSRPSSAVVPRRQVQGAVQRSAHQRLANTLHLALATSAGSSRPGATSGRWFTGELGGGTGWTTRSAWFQSGGDNVRFSEDLEANEFEEASVDGLLAGRIEPFAPCEANARGAVWRVAGFRVSVLPGLARRAYDARRCRRLFRPGLRKWTPAAARSGRSVDTGGPFCCPGRIEPGQDQRNGQGLGDVDLPDADRAGLVPRGPCYGSRQSSGSGRRSRRWLLRGPRGRSPVSRSMRFGSAGPAASRHSRIRAPPTSCPTAIGR